MAGFLLANGALNDSDTLNIRQKLIENDKIEAVIVLPRELFITTDISVTLWILNQNKKAVIIKEEIFATVKMKYSLWICVHGQKMQ
ncbi:MAG: N-6 DNA methylase [Oscillospiraceae bacterium]